MQFGHNLIAFLPFHEFTNLKFFVFNVCRVTLSVCSHSSCSVCVCFVFLRDQGGYGAWYTETTSGLGRIRRMVHDVLMT